MCAKYQNELKIGWSSPMCNFQDRKNKTYNEENSHNDGWFHCNLYLLRGKLFDLTIRRRAAAKRKKLKLVSRGGGGDGELPPEELEEDPEEDSSLNGTGQGGGIWQDPFQ